MALHSAIKNLEAEEWLGVLAALPKVVYKSVTSVPEDLTLDSVGTEYTNTYMLAKPSIHTKQNFLGLVVHTFNSTTQETETNRFL